MEEHMEICRITHDFIILMDHFKHLNFMGLLQELSPAEFMCLKVLTVRNYRGDERVKASELAGSMHISGPAMSKTLRNLERKGWIVRTGNTSDRRTVWVSLSESGRDVYMREDDRIHAFGERIMTSFGKENARQFIEKLEILYHACCEELETMKMEGKSEK